MSKKTKRSTIYFEPQLHAALRLKAVHSQRSLSELVNEAVKNALAEDQEDLAAFEDRAHEPVLSYEELLNDLKAHGHI
ncbi:MAG: CopG family transcriptional regulator [Desulfobulbaceae bacterium]|nr:CopG family transcriptional regulator [Desulfobulbaceae bacterium]